MQVGEVCLSKNYGEFKILKVESYSKVEVEFLLTGFKKSTTKDRVKIGAIKDPFYPIHDGVGFNGVGKYKTTDGNSKTKAYSVWRNMIARCYNEKRLSIAPCYKDVTVCKEWHNFQVFAEWYYNNHPNDGSAYQLDKDALSQGNAKVYSPSTCCFLTCAKNIQKSQSGTFKFLSPKGEAVDVNGLSSFCRDRGLRQSHMSQVHNGKRKSHKGWTKYHD